MTLGSALESLCETVHLSVRPFAVSEMFITLEPRGIILSHFAYMCIATFPNN